MFLSRGVVLSLLPLLLTSTSLAVTIERQLDVVNRVLSPDGFDRITTLAGGSFPGPLIVGKKGDQFSVTVNNKLQNDSLDLVTSIHFHGIDQDRTNYADGTTGVTQCPIIPGESFTYQFNVHSQAGTFWYHSHFAGQYCDGLRGVFVIYDDKDPLHTLYDVDNESTIITLSDWFHYLSTNPPYVPEPSATLINGKGRAIGGPATPLAVVNVLSGLRYRFRVIAMSCDSNFMFSIDAHSLTVIEADAHTTQPHTVDQIQILSGQRYSVIVHANQQVDNYWIRAIRSENNPNITQSIDGGQNAAILRYVGASLTEPSITSTSNLILLKEADLHPFPAAPPPKADEVINLNVTLDMVKGRYLMNGVSFEPPSVPVLLQILSGTRKATDLLPAGAVYGLERNKTYDVVVPAGVLGGPHPLHIHGHSFWVIQSASSVKNEINPVLRDVVNMGDAGDTVTIRFTADNPGPWFFHCHINTHLEAGFAVVFAEDIPSISQASVPSSSWNELCPHYQQYAQGTGNSSASNRSGR